MSDLNFLFFVAEEDDGIYNIFSVYDFDENGFYEGHEDEDGYHIDDFDKVYQTNSWERACRWIENHSI